MSHTYAYVVATKDAGNPDMSGQMDVFQQPLNDVQIDPSLIQGNTTYLEREG